MTRLFGVISRGAIFDSPFSRPSTEVKRQLLKMSEVAKVDVPWKLVQQAGEDSAHPMPPVPHNIAASTFRSGDHFLTIAVPGHTFGDEHIGVSGDFSAPALHKFGMPWRLMQHLQLARAVRTAKANDDLSLKLPKQMDMAHNPSLFNRVYAKLCLTAGYRRIEYTDLAPCDSDLPKADTVKTEATLRAQLEAADSFAQAAGIAAFAAWQSVRCGASHFFSDAQNLWEKLRSDAMIFAGGRLFKTTERAEAVVFGVGGDASLGGSIVVEINTTRPLGGSAQAAQVGTHTFVPTTMNLHLTSNVADKDVVIVCNMRPPPSQDATAPYAGAAERFFETAMLLQAARDGGARSVKLVMAYQTNGRTDRQELKPGQGFSQVSGAYVHLIAECLNALEPDRVVLVEPHQQLTPLLWSPGSRAQALVVNGVEPLIDDVLRECHIEPTLAAKKEASGREIEKIPVTLALSDAGAKKRYLDILDMFRRVIAGDKERPNLEAQLQGMVGDLHFDPSDLLLIPDDETETGSTLKQALAFLWSKGARNMHLVVAHNNLTLNLVERNLRLASFCVAGAQTVRFTDTHQLGQVVASFDELLQLGASTADVERKFTDFCNVEFKSLSGDARAQAEVSLRRALDGLSSRVKVHSIASNIVDELIPRRLN